MKVSTKGRYAIRLMIDLEQNSKGEYVSIKEIAKRQEVSVKYLEQIVNQLNKAGYLLSIRGPHGGYKLAKPAEAYSVGDILRVTEGPLVPVACLEDEVNSCERSPCCITIGFWTGLSHLINEYVDGVTLADLAHEENKTNHCD